MLNVVFMRLISVLLGSFYCLACFIDIFCVTVGFSKSVLSLVSGLLHVVFSLYIC